MSVDRWGIAHVKGSWVELRNGSKTPAWIHPPAGHFYADPFLTIHRGEPWLFFEVYVGATATGHIGCCALARPHEVLDAIQPTFHVSYPYLVESEGALFCAPEQHQSGQVSLYRCHDFPQGWIEETALLPDFPGVDPTLMEWDGHWYLWVGHQQKRPRDQVFLFHSPSLFGPWKCHPTSPVIKWDWNGRNGGRILNYQGRLLRPAQNRTRTYGGGLVFMEIMELSPRSYHEREWGRWEPDPGWPYPDGLHHVCEQDGFTVIDAKLFVEVL